MYLVEKIPEKKNEIYVHTDKLILFVDNDPVCYIRFNEKSNEDREKKIIELLSGFGTKLN